MEPGAVERRVRVGRIKPEGFDFLFIRNKPDGTLEVVK